MIISPADNRPSSEQKQQKEAPPHLHSMLHRTHEIYHLLSGLQRIVTFALGADVLVAQRQHPALHLVESDISVPV